MARNTSGMLSGLSYFCPGCGTAVYSDHGHVGIVAYVSTTNGTGE